MSEKGDVSLNREQAEISPRIEDEIRALLEDNLKQTALEFVAYLNANHLAPRQWFGQNYWRIPYGKHFLCGIVVNQEKWRVWFFSGDYSGAFDEGYMETVHGGVRRCVSCTGDDCPKGRDMMIFGKEFADTCNQFPIQFENPDSRTLDCVRELIEYWKVVAPHSDSWHCR